MKVVLATLGMLAVAAAPAYAQIKPAYAQINMNLASQMALQQQTMQPLNNVRLHNLQGARMGVGAGAQEAYSGGRRPGVGGVSSSRPGVTRYRSRPEVSSKVAAAYVDFTRRVASPAAASGVQEELAHTNFVATWAGFVRDDGLRAGDLVDAYAGYWVLDWAMANTRSTDRAQMQGALSPRGFP